MRQGGCCVGKSGAFCMPDSAIMPAEVAKEPPFVFFWLYFMDKSAIFLVLMSVFEIIV